MRIHDHLDYRARVQPAAECAVRDGRRVSSAQASAYVDRLAGALAPRGLASGDRVAVLAKNSIEFVEFCRGKVAGYQRPRSVDFMDELPRGASGKVPKHGLRERSRTDESRRIG